MNVRVVLGALDTRVCVQVLVEDDLEDRGAALTRGDGRPGEEKLPDAEPPGAVLGDDLVLVAHPVLVPSPERARVVYTKDIKGLDFEAGSLDLVNDPSERAAGVGTGEDVFVHEETPDEIFVLPRGTETSDLKDESAIVVQEIVDLPHECAISPHSDVLNRAMSARVPLIVTRPTDLCHLERNDLGEMTSWVGDLAVVHAKNPSVLWGYAVVCETFVSKSGLVLAESDASDVAAEIFGGKSCKGSPSASINIQSTYVNNHLAAERTRCRGACRWVGDRVFRRRW